MNVLKTPCIFLLWNANSESWIHLSFGKLFVFLFEGSLVYIEDNNHYPFCFTSHWYLRLWLDFKFGDFLFEWLIHIKHNWDSTKGIQWRADCIFFQRYSIYTQTYIYLLFKWKQTLHTILHLGFFQLLVHLRLFLISICNIAIVWWPIIKFNKFPIDGHSSCSNLLLLKKFL